MLQIRSLSVKIIVLSQICMHVHGSHNNTNCLITSNYLSVMTLNNNYSVCDMSFCGFVKCVHDIPLYKV